MFVCWYRVKSVIDWWRGGSLGGIEKLEANIPHWYGKPQKSIFFLVTWPLKGGVGGGKGRGTKKKRTLFKTFFLFCSQSKIFCDFPIPLIENNQASTDTLILFPILLPMMYTGGRWSVSLSSNNHILYYPTWAKRSSVQHEAEIWVEIKM